MEPCETIGITSLTVRETGRLRAFLWERTVMEIMDIRAATVTVPLNTLSQHAKRSRLLELGGLSECGGFSVPLTLALTCLLALAAPLLAETGADAWLRYQRVDSGMRRTYSQLT